MSDMPADILETAEHFLKAPISDDHGNSLFYWVDSLSEEKAVRVIALAILAERERCAKIAEGCGDRAVVFMNEKLGGYSNDFQRYSDGCMSVARFIRDSTNYFESGANAAANSPAPEVSEASPTRKTITTEGKSNV